MIIFGGQWRSSSIPCTCMWMCVCVGFLFPLSDKYHECFHTFVLCHLMPSDAHSASSDWISEYANKWDFLIFTNTERERERQRIVGHKEVDDFIFMLCLTTNFSIGVFHKQSHSVSHVNYLCASIFSPLSLSSVSYLLSTLACLRLCVEEFHETHTIVFRLKPYKNVVVY